MLCPVTNQPKGYPFEVTVPDGLPVTGAVLSDHVKSLSWAQRSSAFIGLAPNDIMDQVRAKIRPLLGFE